ncbi:SWIM zinc finger family protein [Paenibacillus sp. NFR01]|uniref:SWIM zinc finger family protein n=1 Tax=Paenibacillus sp. NFR01 TaxID=1566279 RepID=UPI0008C89164|nr:SWIM zinc finger family protein [Paenibacillus sp. NFR01]SET34731.1 SWIM zinc finger [Paenibacillus sp. NFR01]
MPDITSTYVDSLAPNAAAVKNGQNLVRKNSFTELSRTDSGDLLFGLCAGSGKLPYACSVDFMVPEKPVFRCTCPSRQFPCKHALGLLYAYAEGKDFAMKEVPGEIAAKREKAEKREENKAKQEESRVEDKPKKVNKSALRKKMQAQLEGLDQLEKLALGVVRGGLGAVDARRIKELKGYVKELGNYYLPGAQNELRRLLIVLGEEPRNEEGYSYAMEQLTVIHALIRKGRARLHARLEDPELALDAESTIEEWLGHAWQLSELKSFGRIKDHAELIQLAFHSYNDLAREEFVDEGYWLDLGSEVVHRTVSYRPYKAAKLMREEDSFFEVAQIPALYVYPGDMNTRVRYEEMTSRPSGAEDYQKIRKAAIRTYAVAVKQVRQQLKTPLGDKRPVLLLHAARIGVTEGGQFTATDEAGQTIVLEDIYSLAEGTVHLLPFLPAEALSDCTLLAMFHHNPDTSRLSAQPLTVFKGDEAYRLLY